MVQRSTAMVLAVILPLEAGVIGCGPGLEPSGGSSSNTGAEGVTGSSAQGFESSMDDSGMGPKLDTAVVGWGDVPPPECGDSWGDCVEPPFASDLMASTPVGDFDITVAVFGSSFFCGCADRPVSIVLMPADPTAWDENVQHGLFVDLQHAPAAGMPQEVRLRARRGADFASTDATLMLEVVPTFDEILEPKDPQVPAVVTGSLHVDADGWSASGMFVASYCAAQNQETGSCE